MNLREQSHIGNCARWSIQYSPSVPSLIMYFSLTGFIDSQYKLKECHGCGCICKNVPVLCHRPFLFSSALFRFHSMMKWYLKGSRFNLEVDTRQTRWHLWYFSRPFSTRAGLKQSWHQSPWRHQLWRSSGPAWWLHYLLAGHIPSRLLLRH